MSSVCFCVAARLSAFHGTQCGFCSPGIAVSCHAALAAAAVGRSNCQQAGDGVCAALGQGQGHALDTERNSATDIRSNAAGSSSSGDGSSGNVIASAADLLASLDGNLCRCTGWRPIADMVKVCVCLRHRGGHLQSCLASSSNLAIVGISVVPRP